jgi:signal transduction histidine kinase
VLLHYRDTELELEIRDDGVAAAAAGANGSGHGLIGMRERLSLLGGTLAAGPRSEGGFTVAARLPLESAR